MAKGQTSKTYSSTKLLVPREEAIRKIKEQIETGRHIRDRRMSSMADLDSAQERRTQWLEDNVQMLTRLFDHPFFNEEYNTSSSLDMDSAITFTLKEKYFKDDINEQIGRLESFLERLDLIPEATQEERIEKKPIEETTEQEQPEDIQSMEVQLRNALTRELKSEETPPKEKPFLEQPPKVEPPKEPPLRREVRRKVVPSPVVLNQKQAPEGNILLVHGRDEAAKETLLEFLEKLGLGVLVLQEQPDGGRSLMEKVGESSSIHFAIILFTPDDIAAPSGSLKEKQTRVSQNVIFALGYFMGKLGRGKVCALFKEEVEIPLDYTGVAYIPLDPRGDWRLLLAKEIKQAGIDIDLNRAI
jgi:TusA-related sulfurtransferase